MTQWVKVDLMIKIMVMSSPMRTGQGAKCFCDVFAPMNTFSITQFFTFNRQVIRTLVCTWRLPLSVMLSRLARM